MTFGSTVDLIGCVSRPPTRRGNLLTFILAGEEPHGAPTGPHRAFYQPCLIDQDHPDAPLLTRGRALAVTGHLHQTHNTVSRAARVEVMTERLVPLTRHSTDLILDVGGGLRLRDGHQQVLLWGHLGAADWTVTRAGPLLTMSVASPHPHRTAPNWVDVTCRTLHPDVPLRAGQGVLAAGRLVNRASVQRGSGRVTVTSIDARRLDVQRPTSSAASLT